MKVVSRYARLLAALLTLAALLVLTACSGAKPTTAPAPASAAPTAPAASAAPAAPAAPAFDKLILVESPVRGSANLKDDEKALLSCVLNSKFKKNEQIVWRVKVVDPTTGQELDEKFIEKMQVKLADGKVFDMKFGLRPKDKPIDGFWTTSFTIPEDFPVGTLNYTIEATAKDGRSSQYVKFILPTAHLTVLPDVRPKIAK